MDTDKAEVALQGVVCAMQSMAAEGRSELLVEYLGLLADIRAFYQTYWDRTFDAAYEELMASLGEPADRLLAAAFDADGRQLHRVAASLAEVAEQLKATTSTAVVLAGFMRKSGALGRARELCRAVELCQPDSQKALSELLMCEVAERFWARDYYDLLAEIHTQYRPRVYLEIGVATGKSLALAQRDTCALGIDPVAAVASSLLYHSLRNIPQLYKQTSDEFFTTQDVPAEMGRPRFDLAFIDGLHHFDQVLRDFINLEQFAGQDSVVLIHDCLPVDPRVATRERTTAFWTGDVWRIIPCLQAVRPDLEIMTLPLAPAGLAVVRRLDASSRVLARHYTGIVEQFEQLELPEDWDERCHLLAVQQDETAFRLERIMPAGGWL